MRRRIVARLQVGGAGLFVEAEPGNDAVTSHQDPPVGDGWSDTVRPATRKTNSSVARVSIQNRGGVPLLDLDVVAADRDQRFREVCHEALDMVLDEAGIASL